jgi:integrase
MRVSSFTHSRIIFPPVSVKTLTRRFYDLRHEATSRFFENGLNVMEFAVILVHKDQRMLQRYTHLRAENLPKKLG